MKPMSAPVLIVWSFANIGVLTAASLNNPLAMLLFFLASLLTATLGYIERRLKK